MGSDLQEFVARWPPGERQPEDWRGLRFEVSAHLTDAEPPTPWVTSVRCALVRDGMILVVRYPGELCALPGGRREPVETLEETLRRELIEETGWTLRDPTPLGFLHFRHLGAKPEGYRYPYPEFLQWVFRAEADRFDPDARGGDGDEIDSHFESIEALRAVALKPCHRLMAGAALRVDANANPRPAGASAGRS